MPRNIFELLLYLAINPIYPAERVVLLVEAFKQKMGITSPKFDKIFEQRTRWQ